MVQFKLFNFIFPVSDFHILSLIFKYSCFGQGLQKPRFFENQPSGFFGLYLALLFFEVFHCFFFTLANIFPILRPFQQYFG